jgi:hypothetical protein
MKLLHLNLMCFFVGIYNAGFSTALFKQSRDSSVGVPMGLGLDDLGSIPGRGKILLYCTPSRPGLGPTYPMGTFSGGKAARV